MFPGATYENKASFFTMEMVLRANRNLLEVSQVRMALLGKRRTDVLA